VTDSVPGAGHESSGFGSTPQQAQAELRTLPLDLDAMMSSESVMSLQRGVASQGHSDKFIIEGRSDVQSTLGLGSVSNSNIAK
jgi:hypothetical protein